MARKATGQVIERSTKRRGRVYALRFHAYGERRSVTLGSAEQGWTRKKADAELENVLAAVKLGVWRPPETEAPEPPNEPTFHEFASQWYDDRKAEWQPRTAELYRSELVQHLLPCFAGRKLSEITVEAVDAYKAAKLKEGRLSPNTINRTLTRLSQVLEVAVEYGYLDRNPARGEKRRCKKVTPRRASMGAEQVRALLDAAGPRHRALLATAIMAGGLRVSEVTGLRWRDIDLTQGTIQVAKSKTDAGVREVELDEWLLEELETHKVKARFAHPEHYVFPGRHRARQADGTLWAGSKRRDRNAVRKTVLYPAIERANELLKARGRPLIPDGTDGRPRVTFHSLRRTFASLAAEAGEDPAWTAKQIGHASARFTLDVYTDVHNRRRGRLGALVRGEQGSKGINAFSQSNGASASVEEAAPDSAPQRLNSHHAGA